MTKDTCSEMEVEKVLVRKLDLVRQIRELKALSTQASLDLLKTGNRSKELLDAVGRW